MFDNLTERLSGTFRKLTGRANLTESNIQEAMREVRRALLEADVALPVVKDFIDKQKEEINSNFEAAMKKIEENS